MSLNTKAMSYHCTGPVPKIGQKYVTIGRFPSEVRRNCEIFILIETKSDSRRDFGFHGPAHSHVINIQLQKSNETPAKVDIKLKLSDMNGVKEVSKSVDDWETSCYFYDIGIQTLPLHTVNVVLEIMWTLPESANTPLNISNFLMNELFSDVNIVIGKEILSAHKLILAAASPVMLAMLTSPMKEAAENCIEIKDVEVDVMKSILSFLYTSKDGDFGNVDMALKSLVAAEKYDMREVRELCEQKLLENLSTPNALQILDFADTHQSAMLAKASMTFILNHKKEIVRTEYFEEICTRKPLLMMEFIRAVVENVE